MADLYVPGLSPKAIIEVVGKGLVHNDGTPCSDAEIKAVQFPDEDEAPEAEPFQPSPVEELPQASPPESEEDN